MADEQKQSVKELVELLVGLKDLVVIGKEAFKDGKIDLGDLTLLGQALAKQQELLAAFSGLSELGEEFKTLTLDEAMTVVMKVVDLAKEVNAA